MQFIWKISGNLMQHDASIIKLSSSQLYQGNLEWFSTYSH